MADETLLTAARRAARFFDIDMGKGGIITVETEQAMHTLRQQIEKETQAEKRREKLSMEALSKALEVEGYPV